MKIELNSTIQALCGQAVAIRGTLRRNPDGSRLIIRTLASGEKRLYVHGPDTYVRKTPPTKKELIARLLFSKRSAYVKQLLRSDKNITKSEAWTIAKRVIKD